MRLVNLRVITIILFMSLSLACIEEKIGDSNIIAVAGDRKIDWRLIQRSYHLEPKWGIGLTNKQAYENQLNFLVDQKLYAQAALALGLDKKEETIDYLRFLKEKEMIKELYRREVESKIQISEEAYEKAYLKLKKKIKLAYLRTPDLSSAKNYAVELKSKSLDQIDLINPLKDEKGVTPFFTYGDMTEEIDNVAFDMHLQEISKPFRSEGKYMVIKLLDGFEEKFRSENDLAESKSKIKKIIFEREASKISDAYIRELLENEEVTLNPVPFKRLVEQFNQFVKRENNPDELPVHINDAELRSVVTNIEDIKDDVLVSYKKGRMSVEQFLERLFDMPAGLRPAVNMSQNVKKAIGIIVRDDYLARRAYESGLDKSPKVIYELQWQTDDYLSRRYLEQAGKRLSVSTAEITQFKKGNGSGKIGVTKIETLNDENIKNIVYDYKFLQLKVQLADSLRNRYQVEIDSVRFYTQIEKPNMLIKQNPIKFMYREQFN